MQDEIYTNITFGGATVMRNSPLWAASYRHQWQRRAIQTDEDRDLFDLEIHVWLKFMGRPALTSMRIGQRSYEEAVRWVSTGLLPD